MKSINVFIIIGIILFSTSSFPQTGKYYLEQGDKYYSKFDNFDALISYKKADSLLPNSYEALSKITLAYNNVVEEYLDLRKRKDAAKYINNAVKYAKLFRERYPDSALTFIYLALTYGNQSMLLKSNKDKIKYANLVRQSAIDAIKIAPNNFFPYIILGIYYREAARLTWFEKIFAKTFYGSVPEGTFKQSIEMFHKALSLDSSLTVAYFQIAKTYKRMGEKNKEEKYLKKVLVMPTRNFRDKYAKREAKRMLTRL